MKLFYTLFFSFIIGITAQNISVVPQPNQISFEKGICYFDRNISFEIEENFLSIQKELSFLPPSKKNTSRLIISIQKNKTIQNKESYILHIQPKKITIEAKEKAGVFYAVQTLKQLVAAAKYNHQNFIACMKINDTPRFAYRALMIDPARHYWKIDDLKKYIDIMAQYKFNFLHLHLTDDQGWRIEIKKYPKLTEIGSKRTNFEGSKRNNEGFYTQNEMKELVQYALEQNVQIIPEFDVPGHSDATIAAYPELSCNDTIINVRTTAGVSKNLLCVSKENVFTFIDDVITELSAVFPCQYFHIGGDEAPLDKWLETKSVQELKDKLRITNNHQLVSYFFSRVNESLTKNNKQPLLWFELETPKYPKNSIMYLWRYNTTPQVLERAKKDDFKVICSPGEYTYFDYPQWKDDLPNVNWMPTLSLERVYEFNPAFSLNKEEEEKYIFGVEATLWGESVKDLFRAFYMTYPRALALSEAGWTQMPNRSWEYFTKKLHFQLNYLLEQGVNYRPPVELFSTTNTYK
ncbi:MAG: beta-N-acetylhexosaminidase [Capnocytophaga sp.]|nr:beta-N-acetylhexosaminidase [Capnocytophaga sp.]